MGAGASPTRSARIAVDIGGTFTDLVLLVDDPAAFLEPQGPARVAHAVPGAQDLRGGRRREVAGLGPARHPRLPHGGDALHLRLLGHDLGDQDAPRGRAGTPPRQFGAVVGVEPGEQGRREAVRIDHVRHCARVVRRIGRRVR
jgi:hypothetical protein